MDERLGTLHIVEGRPVLRFERRLSHPPEKVWRAVADPAELAHWFPATVRAEPTVGARMEFSFDQPGVDATGFDEGEILERDPPKVFAFRWADSVLRFELVPDGDGTRLRFSHTLSGASTWGDRPSTARNATGWDACLAHLGAWLDGGPAPSLDGFWLPRTERYVEEFGLAEGEVTAAADGHVIRFERDLTQTPAEVWAALTEGHDGAFAEAAPPPPRATHGYLEPGPVTAADPPRLLEYGCADSSRVRFTLAAQLPLGCRLVLTHTLPEPLTDRRAKLLAAWQTHLELLFAAVHGDARCPWPTDRTDELTRRYARRLG